MRKNMKKRAALLLAAMMTVSVTACGGGKTPDAPSDADLKKDVQEYITEVAVSYTHLAYASEGQVYQRQQGKLKSLTVGFQKQKLVTCMDHEQIKIIYDPIDKGVYKVAFQGSYERVKLFMKKMNSILCPQNYLTTEDYNYILDLSLIHI